MSSVPATDPSYCDLDAVAKGDWAVVIIMLVFTTSLVLLRMYARLIRMKAFGWDDAMLLVAYVSWSIPIDRRTCANRHLYVPGVEYRARWIFLQHFDPRIRTT